MKGTSAQNPNRRPRKFKRSQCRHCGKGLRAHVAQVHPEAYARSRSVRAHRMKETRNGSAGARKEEHKNHTRQREASSHALHSREGSSAALVAHPHYQRETRAETTERIWEEVRKRTPLQTEERRQEIGVAVNRKRHDTGEVV